jgi:transposase
MNGRLADKADPAYVKPYVKSGKNDATDAEAICETGSRPNMRVFPVKSADQQAVLMLHRTRALLIRQQTMLANAFRAHLAEFAFVVPQDLRHVHTLSRYSACVVLCGNAFEAITGP